MSGRGRLRLSPAWSGGARPVGLADAARLTATVPPRAGGTATSDRHAAAPRILGMPLRRPGTTAALRRDRHLAEALDRSEDAWSGAGFNGAVSADLQGLVCRIPDLAGRCCGVRGGGGATGSCRPAGPGRPTAR